ncbi:hypothetical protein ABK040_011291 [Willaertia magna]
MSFACPVVTTLLCIFIFLSLLKVAHCAKSKSSATTTTDSCTICQQHQHQHQQPTTTRLQINNNFTYNGCGTSGEFNEIAKPFGFISCCNVHDICYSNCTTNKLQCDTDFMNCMKEQYTAGLFHMGVAFFGCDAYKSAQKEFCACHLPTNTALGDKKMMKLKKKNKNNEENIINDLIKELVNNNNEMKEKEENERKVNDKLFEVALNQLLNLNEENDE